MIDIPTTITTATPKQAPPANSLLIPATAWFGTQRGVAQPVPLTQYDDTLPMLAVSLYLNGQPYTVPEGAAINVRMDKRDGHYIYNPAYGVSDDRKTVYVAVTLQMTTGAGEYLPILELVVDGDVAGTSVLPMHIAKNPVPEDAVESTDEWKSIQQIAAEVEEAARVVQDNAEVIQYVQENAANITAVAQNGENISAVGENIANVNTVAENLTPIQTAADNIDAIQQAPASASAAAASATLSESWAVGGTGTRSGEDTDNAKYYSEQAQQAAQEALGFRTFFSAVTPDANGDLDPSRPMTTPTAASVTVKSKGDRIQSVQVNGFTQQAGSGDPSPTNVRKISTAGLRMVKLVLTGTENWVLAPSMSGEDPAFESKEIQPPASGVNEGSAAKSQFCTDCPIKNADGNSGACAWVYGTRTVSGVRVRLFGAKSVDQFKSALASRYASGNPVIIWYVPADESQATGLYIPVETQGHECRCQCLELTAPLCDGDKVESCVPSGCDKAITVDGSTVTVTARGSNYVVTASDAAASGNVYAKGLAYLSLTAGQIAIPASSLPASVTSAQTANAWLQSNPQKVWYQSTAYAEANDIPVQLETDESAIVTVDGSDTLFTQGTDGYTVSLPNAANGAVICNRFSGLTAANNAVTISASQFPSSVTSLEQANTWAQSNPVTILYQLAAPAVYAHDPVTLVAVPYTAADVDAANQLANTPSTLPAIDSPDVPMLLNSADNTDSAAQVMPLAANAVPVAGTYVVSSQDGTTLAVSLKAMQDGGDTSAWVDSLSQYYTKTEADARFSDAVAYTIDVPTTGWADGSLTWGGTTYTRKCTVTAADATASPTSVTMAYEGGDYDAYCQIGLIDTQAGSVVLWATADPTAECQIRVLEVRSNGQS